ncbi:hypothetical protein BDP27DRAFT_1450649 [Rhodocollybia butyracea]|uniref:DUF6533 domain-containing protein n=1 Tax=Rhodocollybia butyracea TaxID=206335 RepID=A0A9P5PMJ0_9AGAR|nr:hypothetical protein BDP27DRAFT_1450649 [Rhodocollybia butyracea]
MPDSSSDQVITEEILGLIQTGSYVTLSSFVLLSYDFLLTLPTELRLIWSRQLTGSSMIFILNRYIGLLSLLFLLVSANISLPGQTLTYTSCRDLGLVARIAASANGATMKLLSILRVYALFGQRRSLLILLCPFIIVDIIGAILLWSVAIINTTQGTYLEPFAPCLFLSANNFEAEMFIIIFPFLQLTFDSIIFILTLVQTAGHIMQSRKSHIHSIAEVVLSDGSLYFFIIFIITSIDSAFVFASIVPGPLSDTLGAVADSSVSFLNALTNILINRLVLNLRAFSSRTVQHSGQAPVSPTAPPLGALDFAENRFLGNIGAPLDYNQWDDDELESEVDQRDGDTEWEILDNTVDPLTTLVPVIYDHEKGGPVRFVPMQREPGPRL